MPHRRVLALVKHTLQHACSRTPERHQQQQEGDPLALQTWRTRLSSGEAGDSGVRAFQPSAALRLSPQEYVSGRILEVHFLICQDFPFEFYLVRKTISFEARMFWAEFFHLYENEGCHRPVMFFFLVLC